MLREPIHRDPCSSRSHQAAACLVPVLAALLAGCGSPGGSTGQPAETTVSVAKPLVRPVTDYVQATGRTAAVESVEIRARVTGYIVRIKELLDDKKLLEEIRARLPGYMQTVKLDKAGQVGFEEGEAVVRGQTLFVIDPRPFKADYDRIAAQIQVRQASLKFREADLARNKVLIDRQVISQQEYEAAVAARDEAAAGVTAAVQDLERARLNLEFTDVKSPIDGQVSRAEKTAGNLVSADTTLLTNVVSLDPMYVEFNVDERTSLELKQAAREGKISTASEREVPVFVQLANETGYPHQGVINFADNQVKPDTGSILIRGVFGNPADPRGLRPFQAGYFARVRVPVSEPHDALMVADRAVGADLGQKYLLVVGEDNKVQYRTVELGRLEEGLRVIQKGIGPEDRVIIAGQQLVRPGMTVGVEEMAMPERPAPKTPEPAPGPGAKPPADGGAEKPAPSPAGVEKPAN